jgi:hypothetical protein
MNSLSILFNRSLKSSLNFILMEELHDFYHFYICFVSHEFITFIEQNLFT